MSEINKKDLLNYLQTHDAPVVSTETLHSQVNRFLGSNLVAQAIEGTFRLSPFFSPVTSEAFIESVGFQEYLETCIPRLSFGRCFGHSIGIVKYLIGQAHTKKHLIIVPSENMVKELNENVQRYTNYNASVTDLADVASATMSSFKSALGSRDFKRYGAIIIDEYSFLTDDQIEFLAAMSHKHRIPMLFLGTSKK